VQGHGNPNHSHARGAQVLYRMISDADPVHSIAAVSLDARVISNFNPYYCAVDKVGAMRVHTNTKGAGTIHHFQLPHTHHHTSATRC